VDQLCAFARVFNSQAPISQTLFIVSLIQVYSIWSERQSSINFRFHWEKENYDLHDDNYQVATEMLECNSLLFAARKRDLLPENNNVSFIAKRGSAIDLKYEHFIMSLLSKSFWSENRSPLRQRHYSVLTHLIQTITSKKNRKLTRFCFENQQSTAACFFIFAEMHSCNGNYFIDVVVLFTKM